MADRRPRDLDAGCDPYREAISARLDHEDAPVDDRDLADHLASCASCAGFAIDAEALHRTIRLRAAEDVPDHTETILAAAGAAPGPRSRRPVGAIVLVAAAVLLLLGLSGWFLPRDDVSAEPALSFASGYATAAPQGGSSSLYLSVTNDGGADDLVGVTTPAAARATLHRTQDEDGFVLMSDTEDYPVPAEGTLVFQPGGSHVMLEGLVGPLEVGGRFDVTLEFERSAPKTVTVQVVTLSEVVEIVGVAG
jgi:copper(I)-binding protein